MFIEEELNFINFDLVTAVCIRTDNPRSIAGDRIAWHVKAYFAGDRDDHLIIKTFWIKEGEPPAEAINYVRNLLNLSHQ